MFYLKNDDMEELFRKAAENFEVDTGKASNWEAINNALHNNGDDNDDKKKKKRRFIFWWFLLFPAGWIAHNTWDNMGNRGNIAHKKYTVPVEYQPVDKKENNHYTVPSAGITVAEKDKIINEDASAAVARNLNSSKNKLNAKVPDGGSAKATAQQKPFKPAQTAASKNAKRGSYKKEGTIATAQPVPVKKVFENNNKYQGSKFVQAPIDTYSEDKLPLAAPLQAVTTGLAWTLSPVTDNNPLQQTVHNSTNALTDKDGTIQEKKKEVTKDKTHYFYVEALAAPDLSTVKFQHFSGTGSSIGLLLGYRINKRFHVEAGAFLEKKIYYTKGDYFDKSKLSEYYRTVEMLYVDGNCKMITVPVNIRYNLYAGKKTNWFVASGMSSYFMSNEYYDYTYRHPGEPPRTRGYEYKVSENNWLTVVNINVGYERTFWKTFNFRAEPYFRLPVSGVGTGNLSLSSAGIYIGIGKKF